VRSYRRTIWKIWGSQVKQDIAFVNAAAHQGNIKSDVVAFQGGWMKVVHELGFKELYGFNPEEAKRLLGMCLVESCWFPSASMPSNLSLQVICGSTLSLKKILQSTQISAGA
jgi:hypothetical protein